MGSHAQRNYAKFLQLLFTMIIMLLQRLKTPENLFGHYFVPILGLFSAKKQFLMPKKSQEKLKIGSGKVRNLASENRADTLIIDDEV